MNQALLKTHENLGKTIKGPEHIGIDVTNKCNMKCLHCFNRSDSLGTTSKCNELSNQEMYTLAKSIRNIEPPSLCFCGGEPLLRFDVIIQYLNIINKNITTPSMVSNGYLLTQSKANELVENGLRNIQISIDGADAQTHEKMRGVKGAYSKAIDALRFAYNAKMPMISVAFSPTCFNIFQFSQIAEQMHNLGVQQLRVQPLMKLGQALSNLDIFPDQTQYHKLHCDIIQSRRKYPNMTIEWGDPIDHLIRFPNVLTFFVPFLNIKSDGSISLSPYLPINIGNIRRHSIQEYWDEGIQKIWTLSIFQDIANYISSPYDFCRHDTPLPLVYYDSFVDFDLIDDQLFKLNETELNLLYWEKLS